MEGTEFKVEVPNQNPNEMISIDKVSERVRDIGIAATSIALMVNLSMSYECKDDNYDQKEKFNAILDKFRINLRIWYELIDDITLSTTHMIRRDPSWEHLGLMRDLKNILKRTPGAINRAEVCIIGIRLLIKLFDPMWYGRCRFEDYEEYFEKLSELSKEMRDSFYDIVDDFFDEYD